MKATEQLARRVVSSVPVLSRRPVLMGVFDAVDRLTSLPFAEFRSLPPNRLRIRVGVGNRLLFNQAAFLEYGAGTVVELLSENIISLDSNIVDIGCGCGRFPHALERFHFAGSYTGIDVDSELLDWCESHFRRDRYRFHLADVFSKVYNPSGGKTAYRLPFDDGTQDLVIGQSLFTHLLEDDLRNYVQEAYRVLRPGRTMFAGVFSLEDMRALDLLGGRWSFPHRSGPAWVQSLEFPEAAVAYERAFLIELCRDAGFASADIVPRRPQSLLICRK